MSLTVKTITAAEPGAVLRDADVRGLELRARASKKVFHLRYTFRGAERRPRIGDWPTLTINEARRIAKAMLVQVAAGTDPAAERRPDGMTIDDLIALWTDTKLHRKKAGYTIKRMFGLISQRLGSKHAALLTLAEVEKEFAAISKETPVQANRWLAHLSVLLTLAERVGARPMNSNFCAMIERNRETKRDRYLKPGVEAQAVGKAIRAAFYGKDHEAALFIMLLLLTGARKSEITNALSTDLQGNVLLVRRHKTDSTAGAKQIMFPKAALILLNDPKRPLHSRDDYLVGVADPVQFWKRVRKEAGCLDLRMHDLRHSFVSFAVANDVPLSLAGQLVGHASPQTTKRYEHLLTDAGTAAVNKAADGIIGALQLEHKEPAE